VAAARLVRSGRPLAAAARDGWLETTVPEVRIHELIEVRLEPGK
jgi:hypothetical protein